MKRILITGADGFVGRALARALAGQGALTLTDRQITSAPQGATQSPGDLTDPTFLQGLMAQGHDLIFHLASLPGALAEAEPTLGRAINLHLPIALATAAAQARPGARFVFASSIAVYGPLNAPVTPATAPHPALSYGAHKWMTEILLTDLSRRGDLSAISLRLPGIVARPAQETGHGSAFMSQLFHHIAAGRAYDCPVPQHATCWWMSRQACIAALLHAANLAPDATLIQPPVLHLTCGQVAEAVAHLTGQTPRITWGQDTRLTALFGAMPPLDASPALAAGFRADADAATLARHALSGE